MSLQQAETAAAKLLSTSWWTDDVTADQPLPVDPFVLARGLGIAVQFESLPSDESGNIVVPGDGGPVITLNRFDHPNRQRFTCAHEIGHYVQRLESGDVGTRTFVDRRSDLAGLGVDPIEIYANQFAAALLMPAHLVRRYYDSNRPNGGQLASMLGTSAQAMAVRLRNLRLE